MLQTRPGCQYLCCLQEKKDKLAREEEERTAKRRAKRQKKKVHSSWHKSPCSVCVRLSKLITGVILID